MSAKYFEIYRSGELVNRGDDFIDDDLSFDNELMYSPTLNLTLPITYHDYISGNDEMKVFANGKCFWGIVRALEEDKAEETIELELEHIVCEWRRRQISVNNAIKDKKVNIIFKGSKKAENGGVTVSANPIRAYIGEKLTSQQYIERAGASAWNTNGDRQPVTVDASAVKEESGEYDLIFKSGNASVSVKVSMSERSKDAEDIYPDVTDPSVIDQLSDIFADMNFAYPGWFLNMSGDAENTTIDYVYSRQNKLDALTKTMELTPDLFWRVGFVNDKVIDISKFGEKKEWIISKKPPGANNIQIIEEPVIEHDFDNVVNLATVYSDKSDSGMSSMTLREVYERPQLQKDGFPVVIIRANVNNERDYTKYIDQYPKLAPNNELEYAIIDEESVALEGGAVIEGTFAFNDLSPFTVDTEDGKTTEISDADRIKAAQTAYEAGIRKLMNARRSYRLRMLVTQLPNDLNIGDRVRFVYDNSLYILDSCSNYEKMILSYDDWFYITRIEYRIGDSEVDEITLEKYLRIERDINDD